METNGSVNYSTVRTDTGAPSGVQYYTSAGTWYRTDSTSVSGSKYQEGTLRLCKKEQPFRVGGAQGSVSIDPSETRGSGTSDQVQTVQTRSKTDARSRQDPENGTAHWTRWVVLLGEYRWVHGPSHSGGGTVVVCTLLICWDPN